jgi:enolase
MPSPPLRKGFGKGREILSTREGFDRLEYAIEEIDRKRDETVILGLDCWAADAFTPRGSALRRQLVTLQPGPARLPARLQLS